MLMTIGQDFRYACRLLLRKPGFIAIAVLTLGAGIGATVTIFSLMNAALLRPLASDDPHRVIRITAKLAGGSPVTRFSVPDFRDLRERSTTLADLNGANLGVFVLDADNRTDQILGEIVSGQYLSMLGARVSHGRTLLEADDRAGATPVAVISDALWRRRFGGVPVAGRAVLMNGLAYTIVGVSDGAFFGSFIGAPIDVWVPIGSAGPALGPNAGVDRTRRTLSLIGRMKPGVTAARARGELQAIADALRREFIPADRFETIEVAPGTLAAGDQRRLAGVFLSLLLGLVALVLLVACANVGNLLLARVFARRRELAIRLALGAGRARLARMIVIEGAIVAAAGGIVALMVSIWTSRV